MSKSLSILALAAMSFSVSSLASEDVMPCESHRQLMISMGLVPSKCPDQSEEESENSTDGCMCTGGIFTCFYSLDQFELSDFTHPEMGSFVERISNDIRAFDPDRVRFLQVAGYADGTSDAEGAGRWEEVEPKVCNPESKKGIFYDEDLARIRGCMVHWGLQRTSLLTLDLLERDVPVSRVEAIDYETDPDFADAAFRKVELKFTVAGGCP